MREIKISIETAQRWANGTDEELKALALQTYPELAKKELPKTWEELEIIEGYWVDETCSTLETAIESKNHNRNVFATKEQAEASIALAQLSQLMKVYNHGWEPNWSDYEFKFCIYFNNNNIAINEMFNSSCFLSFKDKEIAEIFLKNFRELIEQAKPLL